MVSEYTVHYAPEDLESPIECYSCGGSVLTTETSHMKTHNTVYLCELCSRTYAGNAAFYPDQYQNGRGIHQHVCAVANILLEKVKEYIDERMKK